MPPDAAGNQQKASEYYGKLVDLTKNADTERPETQEAKAFLARKMMMEWRRNDGRPQWLDASAAADVLQRR